MTDSEIIAVVQAHKEGKQIQSRVRQDSPLFQARIDGEWLGVPVGRWDFQNVEYRVTPEPRKPREWKAYVSSRGGILPYPPLTEISVPEDKVITVREVIE